jgi:membrane associated rhomboid family serine protease
MSFFQEVRRPREPLLNAPAVVLWLIAALIAAHVARVLSPDAWPDEILFQYGFVTARYAHAFAEGLSGNRFVAIFAPFITYVFLHADLAHLGINCLWLLAFGPIVARRLKPLKFLLFFFVCGLFAALLHLAAYWRSPVPVVGASGAISGLMAGGMRILYGILYGSDGGGGHGGKLAPVLSKPILIFSAVWVVGNALSGVFGLGVTNQLAVVAWVAHLGGYFAGLLLIGPMDRLPWGVRVRPA